MVIQHSVLAKFNIPHTYCSLSNLSCKTYFDTCWTCNFSSPEEYFVQLLDVCICHVMFPTALDVV